MNAPQTHLAKAGCEPRPCDTCATVFTPKRAWSRFCGPKCRNEHHAEARRKELMREAAPDLYEALLLARGAMRGKDMEHIWLNAPQEPAVTLSGKIDLALAKAGYKEPKPEKAKA